MTEANDLAIRRSLELVGCNLLAHTIRVRLQFAMTYRLFVLFKT
jgi:hypothetical protein